MGACNSKSDGLTPEEKAKLRDAQKQSRELDAKMKNDYTQEKQINKLLLLGAGESGKSTLFKQMIEIYGNGFSEEERRGYISIIHNNIIASMKTLSEMSDVLAERSLPTKVAPEAESSRQHVLECKANAVVDPDLARHLQLLWDDQGIQCTYQHRALFQLTDSAAYFFSQLGTVSEPDYLPSTQDVLRSRVRTTGIVENSFIIEGNQFKMFDVGGQRNERKKWIHCFSEVTAVLFVAALSEYDQVLFEDESQNRMREALTLFDEICNSIWFTKTAMILMLNKKDLFAEKVVSVPLTVCFPEYDGLNNFEDGVQFIEQEFLALNKNPSKPIYIHVTCATDTNNMRVVFNAVKDIVIRKSLAEGGLLAM